MASAHFKFEAVCTIFQSLEYPSLQCGQDLRLASSATMKKDVILSKLRVHWRYKISFCKNIFFTTNITSVKKSIWFQTFRTFLNNQTIFMGESRNFSKDRDIRWRLPKNLTRAPRILKCTLLRKRRLNAVRSLKKNSHYQQYGKGVL